MGLWDGALLEESWGSEVDDVFEVHDTMEVPLLGVVAAGEPYRAFGLDETLSVPTTLWGGKQVFALRVKGSSMIDEGIHHGDYLIVEPRQTAENGQTVVAEIDGAVTVKKYFREASGAVRLQPANPEMLPLIVRGDVRIIGIVVGIMRKFGPPRVDAPALGTPNRRAASRVPRATVPSRPTAPVDSVSLDLAVNAIQSQLVRWNAAMEHAARDKSLKKHLPEMAELGRDLQALSEWCGRTAKPGLRRALIVEANRIMRRMQRFATVTPVQLPDLVLH
jgi:repressor LexA